MRRATCHPDRPNHDGKGKCWECAEPDTSKQQVSRRTTNCLGQKLTTVSHPRRGVLLADEVIARLIEDIWALGIEVSEGQSTHSYPGWEGNSYLVFRDFQIRDTHPDQEIGVARHRNQAQRLLTMLEAIDRDVRYCWDWKWDEGNWMSSLVLPVEDLPRLAQLVKRVGEKVPA